MHLFQFDFARLSPMVGVRVGAAHKVTATTRVKISEIGAGLGSLLVDDTIGVAGAGAPSLLAELMAYARGSRESFFGFLLGHRSLPFFLVCRVKFLPPECV